MIHKYAEIFCWKNVSSFCSAKATHIFSAKNIRILHSESAKTVNEMTLNELVKLTTLWTTGPSFPKCFAVRVHEEENIFVACYRRNIPTIFSFVTNHILYNSHCVVVVVIVVVPAVVVAVKGKLSANNEHLENKNPIWNSIINQA